MQIVLIILTKRFLYGALKDYSFLAFYQLYTPMNKLCCRFELLVCFALTNIVQ